MNSSCGQSWGCNAVNPEISFYCENTVNCAKPEMISFSSNQLQPDQLVPRAFYNGFSNVENGQLYANPAYAPCQSVSPWNYSLCYGFYGQQQSSNPCQFTQFIDIEDFM